MSAARPPVDLDAYCERIGYRGPRTPTLGTLRALQAAHVAAIPFEAVDVLLGRDVDISPAAVDAKLIGKRRGGYCYEQNGLFKRVLRAVGFRVEGLLARVRWQSPEDAPPTPRTHMALRVEADGAPWLADVGFGAAVPTAPLRMDTAEPQPTPQEPFRLLPSGGAGGGACRRGSARGGRRSTTSCPSRSSTWTTSPPTGSPPPTPDRPSGGASSSRGRRRRAATPSSTGG